MKKIFISLVIIISLFFSAVCGHAENIPSPSGWVNDSAGVISSEDRDKITSIVTELEQKTGAEIFVLTVASIAPYDEKSYARMVFDSWKPGKKGKDNGVLVLLAIKERCWRIETGYGLEGILPDGLCGQMGRNNMVPYFKGGKYGEGLYQGVRAITNVIAKNAHTAIVALDNFEEINPEKQSPSTIPSGLVLLLIFIVILLLISISNSTRYGKRYYGGGFGGGVGGGGFGGGSGGFGGGGFGGGGGGFGGGGGAGGRF